MGDGPDSRVVSQDEARARAEELNRALPDGADHHWIAHHAGGEAWQVVRMSALGMRFSGSERHETTQARPEREGFEAPADPRPTINRLIPPFGPN